MHLPLKRTTALKESGKERKVGEKNRQRPRRVMSDSRNMKNTLEDNNRKENQTIAWHKGGVGGVYNPLSKLRTAGTEKKETPK